MELKDLIYTIHYVTSTPVKDVGEIICRVAMNDDQIIERLATHFVRGVHLNNVYYNKGQRIIDKRIGGERGRISIRFSQTDYDTIAAIAYALDCSPSRAVAIIIDLAIQDGRAVGQYLKWHTPARLGLNQYKALTGILNKLGITDTERLISRK